MSLCSKHSCLALDLSASVPVGATVCLELVVRVEGALHVVLEEEYGWPTASQAAQGLEAGIQPCRALQPCTPSSDSLVTPSCC